MMCVCERFCCISIRQLQLQKQTSTHFNNDYYEYLSHNTKGGLDWRVIAHWPLKLSMGFKDLNNDNNLHVQEEHVCDP